MSRWSESDSAREIASAHLPLPCQGGKQLVQGHSLSIRAADQGLPPTGPPVGAEDGSLCATGRLLALPLYAEQA